MGREILAAFRGLPDPAPYLGDEMTSQERWQLKYPKQKVYFAYRIRKFHCLSPRQLMEHYRCGRCGENKPGSQFPLTHQGVRGKVSWWNCKECRCRMTRLRRKHKPSQDRLTFEERSAMSSAIGLARWDKEGRPNGLWRTRLDEKLAELPLDYPVWE